MLKKVLEGNWITLVGVVIIANLLGDFLGSMLFNLNEANQTRWIRAALSVIGVLYFAFPLDKKS